MRRTASLVCPSGHAPFRKKPLPTRAPQTRPLPRTLRAQEPPHAVQSAGTSAAPPCHIAAWRNDKLATQSRACLVPWKATYIAVGVAPTRYLVRIEVCRFVVWLRGCALALPFSLSDGGGGSGGGEWRPPRLLFLAIAPPAAPRQGNEHILIALCAQPALTSDRRRRAPSRRTAARRARAAPRGARAARAPRRRHSRRPRRARSRI